LPIFFFAAPLDPASSTMAKLSAALLAALVASSAAFAPQKSAVKSTSLAATSYWDPMGLYTLGNGEAFDTFPNMFPHQQYLDAAEKKNGRMAMLGWTGVWATHQVREEAESIGALHGDWSVI
jgi:Chlorophyll A-B binding protein